MSVPLWRALELLSYRMLLFLDNVSDPLLWALSRTVDSGLHDLTFLFWKLCPNLGQGSWGPQYSWLAVHRAEPLSYGWEMVEEESSWPLGPTHQEFLNLKLKGIWNVGGLPFLVRYIKSLLGAKRKGGPPSFWPPLPRVERLSSWEWRREEGVGYGSNVTDSCCFYQVLICFFE